LYLVGRGELPLLLPVVPNSPHKSIDEHDVFGEVTLRTNTVLQFTENSSFDPALLRYDDNYQNSQAYSPTFQRHMQGVCQIIKDHFDPRTRIVEVGCGKGDFVNLLESNGYPYVFGYDAAYEGNNPKIISRYLNQDDSIDAELIVLRHTLEHIKRPHHFLRMLRSITNDNCYVYIEVPCFDWIQANQAYFDITYEHVNYFNLRSLAALFDQRVKASGAFFGNQYLYVIARLGDLSENFFLEYEHGQWSTNVFSQLFPRHNADLQSFKEKLANGRKGYVWGCATKGCLFLHYCRSVEGLLDSVPFAVDINPMKVGKYLPSSKVPIKSKNDLFDAATNNDVIAISNPNYFEEIKADLAQYGLATIELFCL
jgi:SAM-dependent methyltransferase